MLHLHCNIGAFGLATTGRKPGRNPETYKQGRMKRGAGREGKGVPQQKPLLRVAGQLSRNSPTSCRDRGPGDACPPRWAASRRASGSARSHGRAGRCLCAGGRPGCSPRSARLRTCAMAQVMTHGSRGVSRSHLHSPGWAELES